MKLTGKCKEDFLNHHDVEEKWFNDEYVELFENAQIVEWFDSVGFLIEVQLVASKVFSFDVHTDSIYEEYNVFKTRQEAINAAIEKANEIYNNTYKN